MITCGFPIDLLEVHSIKQKLYPQIPSRCGFVEEILLYIIVDAGLTVSIRLSSCLILEFEAHEDR